MKSDPYIWHIGACRSGYDNPHAPMQYYVQRYINDPTTRYTGEMLCVAPSYDEAKAQALADRCNAGRFASGRDQAMLDADGAWIAAVTRTYL